MLRLLDNILWAYSIPSSTSPHSSYTSLPIPIQFQVLSFFSDYIESNLCFGHEPALETTFKGPHNQKKLILSPRKYQMSIVSKLMVGLHTHFPSPTWILSCLRFFKSCAWCHHLCEFKCVTTLSHLNNTLVVTHHAWFIQSFVLPFHEYHQALEWVL